MKFKVIQLDTLKSFVKSPTFIILAISLAILALQIAFVGKYRPFNSDDLYWQQAVQTWRPFSGNMFYFGTHDIFVALGPFFAIFEYLFEPSRKLLILETFLLTSLTFVLCYASALYFMAKLKVKATYVTLLPFAWLASFGYPLVQNYLNSDWRTFQIGFSFATFAIVAAYLNGDIQPFRHLKSKVLTGIGIAIVALLMYGDPYFTYFTLGPLAVFVAALFLLKKITRASLLVLYAGIAISLVASKAWEALFDAAGIYVMAEVPSQFVNFDNIVTNIVASLHGMLIIFNADFFGRETTNPATVGFIVNAILLGVVLYKTYGLRHNFKPNYIKQNKLTLSQLWIAFLALTMAFIFAVYTSSSLVQVTNYRFFIMFIYCSVVLLCLVLATTKNRYLQLTVCSLLLVGTVFNVAYTTLTDSVRSRAEVAVNVGNSVNYDILDNLRAEGLTKGYSTYWQGNVNTYFSGNTIAFLPSICGADGKTTQFPWLMDGGQFQKKATESFYIHDPDILAPASCKLEEVEAQFGVPKKTKIVSNKIILIYDYDISEKILENQPKH